jgi:hypothetical protein
MSQSAAVTHPAPPVVPLLPALLGVPPVDEAPPVDDPTPLVPLALEPVPMLFPVEEVTTVVLRQPPRSTTRIKPTPIALMTEPRSTWCCNV